MDEVAVGGVNLDEVEPRGECIARSRDPVPDDVIDSLSREGDGRVVRTERLGVRSDRLPATVFGISGTLVIGAPPRRSRSLAPGVGELNTGNRTLRPDEIGNSLPRGDLFRAPNTDIVRRDAANRINRCCFRHH